MPRIDKMFVSTEAKPKGWVTTFSCCQCVFCLYGKSVLKLFLSFRLGTNVSRKVLKVYETLHKFEEEIKKWVLDCKCRLCEEWVEGVGKINPV